jgi:uncharacterized membrane protein (DUF106 family)
LTVHSNPVGKLAVAAAFLWLDLLSSPLAIVVILSVLVGFLMVILFGYTSDQKAIGVAKDQLKAHLLAVRLYRDQIPVVIGSYGKILRGTGRYLKLAFKPLLYVIIPITLLMVQADRYLGITPIPANKPFLLTVHGESALLNDVTLDLPPEIEMTAPPVHIAAENSAVWRLEASKEGKYEIKIVAGSQSTAKDILVGKDVSKDGDNNNDLPRISPVRLRGHFWERMLSSAEPAIPEGFPVESISISYPDRNIEIAGYEINWIWLFFILSMIAGFIFKEILGIKI